METHRRTSHKDTGRDKEEGMESTGRHRSRMGKDLRRSHRDNPTSCRRKARRKDQEERLDHRANMGEHQRGQGLVAPGSKDGPKAQEEQAKNGLHDVEERMVARQRKPRGE
eukprot:15846-Prorocentrum_lima.AAC.1